MEKPSNELLKTIISLRQHTSPEMEYLTGGLGVVVCILLLGDLQSMPQMYQELNEIFKQLPAYSLTLVLEMIVFFGMSVDGAVRIVKERLPYAKAYLDTFVFSPRKNKV